jgi:hypothetical protein
LVCHSLKNVVFFKLGEYSNFGSILLWRDVV